MASRYEKDLLIHVRGNVPLVLPGYPETWGRAAQVLAPYLDQKITVRWTSRKGTVSHQATGILTKVEGRLFVTKHGTITIVLLRLKGYGTATLYSADFEVARV